MPDRVGEKCGTKLDRQVCPNLCSGRGKCVRGQCHCRGGAYGADCSLEISAQETVQISKMAYPNRQVGSPEVGKSRKRPLVFVYDLPPTFNSELLTRRKRGQPVPYEFKEEGKVSMTKWYYAIEFMLHEWLLSSEHRTADPKEADYFYIPIYAETYDQEGEVNSHADIEKQARGIATVQMFVAAQQHLEKQYPHWNRNNGTDHFWLFAWDEGSWIAPRHLRNSILIDHLGGFYGSENFCKTTYKLDCWSPPTAEFEGLLLGKHAKEYESEVRAVWTNPKHEHGGYPCTDPDKDITLPPHKFAAIQAPPLHPKKAKTKLFTFVGDLGKEAHRAMGGPIAPRIGRKEARYSHGTRQTLTKLWAGRADLGMHIFAGHTPNYHSILDESVFCGVFVGDGWSGAVVDYVNHGCIPVFIHDTVGGAYSGVLDQSKFSLRVPEVNITNLPYLLADVPPERVAELQRELVEVQSRFGYESWYRRLGEQMAHVFGPGAVEMPAFARKPGSDAFETLMEALAAKLGARSRAP